MRESMVAVERGAEAIAQGDCRVVVTAGDRQRQRIAQIENVRSINPDIIVAGIGAHRRDGAVGLSDHDAGMHEAAARAHGTQFGDGGARRHRRGRR